MIVERSYPNTFESLLPLIKRYATETRSVAVQAGHYLVYYDHTEDILLPCVREELNSPRHSVIMNSVGVFPFLTWQTGLDLLRHIDGMRKGILTVVNDWQYLPPNINRSAFYKTHNKLFDAYTASLANHSGIALITQRDMGFKVQTGSWFSEVSLRNQFKRQMEKLIKQGILPSSFEIQEIGETLSCSLVDTVGNRQEVYCTGRRPSCTQEIAELVRQVCIVANFDVFINFYPLVCKQYVQAGTELAFGLFQLQENIVINVGMPSGGIGSASDLFKVTDISVHQSQSGGIGYDPEDRKKMLS